MFHVGQRVVCVPTARGAGGCLELIRDKVVEVLAAKSCTCCKPHHLVMVYVDGLPTYCDNGGSHGGEFYDSQHFRPITDLEEQMYWLEKDQHVHVEELEQELCVPINN
jgi:hypothetical protein